MLHTRAWRVLCFTFMLIGLLPSAVSHAHASSSQHSKKITAPPVSFELPKSSWQSSPSLLGMPGLNTVPSARMDPVGTVRIGASTLDPYYHVFTGLQVAEPLYVQFRQSGELYDESPQTRFYPGMDLKLRLQKEARYIPEVSLGLNSFLGDKRFSSEYVAVSKRYRDFDFTTGVAWGRLGSAGHFKNPLRRISSHFGKDRDLTSSLTNSVEDLFTGEEIGFFGGIEYFPSWTGIDGLSLKADWGADRYQAERLAFGQDDAPAPWSLGVNYTYKNWLDISAGTIGTDKLFARLSFQNDFGLWPWQHQNAGTPIYTRPYRTENGYPASVTRHAHNDGITLHSTQIDGHDASAILELNPHLPASLQLGRAARHMSNHAGYIPEQLTITPYHKHLRGQTVSLIRNDFINAAARERGSPEEIWQDLSFAGTPPHPRSFTSWQTHNSWLPRTSLEIKTDFMSDDHGLLHRSSLLLEKDVELPYGFLAGGGLRVNLYNNLDELRDTRLPALNVSRSAEERFASPLISLDRAFLSYLNTPKTDFHFAAIAGYLEETYIGGGAEVLYRPFGKTFALGLEGWKLFTREPSTSLNTGFWVEEDRFTGHVNLFYEPPNTDYTAYAKIGRYLGADFGATLGVKRQFASGLKFDAYITSTDEADPDNIGGSLNLTSGLRLTLPIGSLNYLPPGSEIRYKAEPVARDTGQIVDKPLDLYDLTEPMSYRHLSRNWGALLE